MYMYTSYFVIFTFCLYFLLFVSFYYKLNHTKLNSIKFHRRIQGLITSSIVIVGRSKIEELEKFVNQVLAHNQVSIVMYMYRNDDDDDERWHGCQIAVVCITLFFIFYALIYIVFST